MNKFRMGEVFVKQGRFDTVFVTRPSMLSGKTNTRCIPGVTVEQVTEFLLGRIAGTSKMAQDVFPNMMPDDREFLISGVTPEEWRHKMAKPETE